MTGTDQFCGSGYREEEKAGILLTGRIVVENRVVTPPAANLEFDQLTMSENKKTDKPFLLQSSKAAKVWRRKRVRKYRDNSSTDMIHSPG